MKLYGDFFKIEEFTLRDAGFDATITVDPKHVIYQGHFPRSPVTPAVIHLRIIEELLERHLEKSLSILKTNSSKFLAIHDPSVSSQIVLSVQIVEQEDSIKVRAEGKNMGGDLFRAALEFEENID